MQNKFYYMYMHEYYSEKIILSTIIIIIITRLGMSSSVERNI